MSDDILKKVDPSRRGFLRSLAGAAAFAAPTLLSFRMGTLGATARGQIVVSITSNQTRLTTSPGTIQQTTSLRDLLGAQPSAGTSGKASWKSIPGRLKQISVGGASHVWGVNVRGEIFRRNASRWDRVSGALKQVSVGSAAHVWGVTKTDYIYRWNGKAWTMVPGKLSNVSVASDGTVWGVTRT